MSAPFYVPPEQLVKDRADFARKGVGRGRPIVAVTLEEGILMVGENSSPALRKIGEVYDRMAFAGVGRFNEFETLRVAGVRYADLKGYSYARADVTAKGLANAYSQTLGQIFSHEVKPYEVDIVVAQLGADVKADQLFRIQFDGTLRDAHILVVLGAGEEAIQEQLAESIAPTLGVDDALDLICGAIEQAAERQIPDEAWETGLLDRSAGRRTFRRLSVDEVSAARDR
ncbi:MAG: proteasome subunit alpha [Actinomycetia bacterium]|nr:proteasome subunit alpha [Actinomycetes bacterium]